MQGEVVQRPDIYGIVALALWALIMVVTVKYVLFLMRADNKGEGGVLSLMALAQRAIGRRTRTLFFLGLVGASLFYGDAVITPAISVLSAIEGLKTIPSMGHLVTTDLVVMISIAHPARPVLRPGSRHRQGRRHLRADHVAVVRLHGGAGGDAHPSTTRGCFSQSTRSTASNSWPTTASSASWCWARCS